MIAEAAGGFFDGLGVGFRFGGGVDAGVVEGNVEFGGKGLAEGEVGVGFRSAKAVVEVRGVKHEAEFPALFPIPLGECTQEGDGVGSAGERDGEAQAGAEERRVDGERGAHERMIIVRACKDPSLLTSAMHRGM